MLDPNIRQPPCVKHSSQHSRRHRGGSKSSEHEHARAHTCEDGRAGGRARDRDSAARDTVRARSLVTCPRALFSKKSHSTQSKSGRELGLDKRGWPSAHRTQACVRSPSCVSRQAVITCDRNTSTRDRLTHECVPRITCYLYTCPSRSTFTMEIIVFFAGIDRPLATCVPVST